MVRSKKPATSRTKDPSCCDRCGRSDVESGLDGRPGRHLAKPCGLVCTGGRWDPLQDYENGVHGRRCPKCVKRYVVRTGIRLESSFGERLELVFCSKGESGWLLPVGETRARRAKCQEMYLSGDLLKRGPCGKPESHELISLDEAHSKGVINSDLNSVVSLTMTELLRSRGLRVSRDWRAA